MVETQNPVSRFRHEIRRIIEEIEACMPRSRAATDREYEFQRRAFEERCLQAEQLAHALGPEESGDAEARWARRDGDAHRIHESLRMSLDYFRGDLTETAGN